MEDVFHGFAPHLYIALMLKVTGRGSEGLFWHVLATGISLGMGLVEHRMPRDNLGI